MGVPGMGVPTAGVVCWKCSVPAEGVVCWKCSVLCVEAQLPPLVGAEHGGDEAEVAVMAGA
jgi:hypothetical protein